MHARLRDLFVRGDEVGGLLVLLASASRQQELVGVLRVEHVIGPELLEAGAHALDVALHWRRLHLWNSCCVCVCVCVCVRARARAFVRARASRRVGEHDGRGHGIRHSMYSTCMIILHRARG